MVKMVNFMCACLPAKSLQLYPTLCNPMDCSPPGSSFHGILQAKMLEWEAISSPKGFSNLGIEPTSITSPALAGIFFTTKESESEVAQSYSTLCDPMECSLPGSSLHGILLARILEWAANFFSRGFFLTQGSKPGLLNCR